MVRDKPDRLLLEVCIGSAEDAVCAEQGGADRVELNAALPLGGLTPSLGTLIETKRVCSLPLIAMLRPREGGFCYSDGDFRTMQRDLDLLLEHGVEGVAFGVLAADGEIDRARSEQVVRQAGDRQVVFHRAFDVVPQPLSALHQLVEIGVRRVLTSGQAVRAMDGIELIRQLHETAAGRIEILPGCGIRADQAATLLAATGCRQLHASLREPLDDGSCRHNLAIGFSSLAQGHGRTSAAALAAMRYAMDQRS